MHPNLFALRVRVPSLLCRAVIPGITIAVTPVSRPDTSHLHIAETTLSHRPPTFEKVRGNFLYTYAQILCCA